MAEPLTREEKYLNAIANSQNINLKPITREEIFLAKASGQDITTPTPITRREMFLSKISSGSKPEQEKTVEITKNGATEIFPDEGYVLSKVTANVNVPTASGENKFAQLVEGTLTEITAEDLEGITKIKDRAFYKNLTITSIEFPNSITEMGDYVCAENDKILTSVVLPENAQFTRIPNYFVYWCQAITNMVIPNTYTEIGKAAFSTCTKLSSITLSNALTKIGDFCFNGCNNLRDITLPDSLTTLGTQAFNSCPVLTQLTIPQNVSRIDSHALVCGSSSNKATFTFLPTTPPNIYANTFNANYLNKIIVPVGCGEAYKSATNWANFADYIEEATE